MHKYLITNCSKNPILIFSAHISHIVQMKASTQYLFLITHVVAISLLHHLLLPALLFKGLLDELGNFTLLSRLLSPNNKPRNRGVY